MKKQFSIEDIQQEIKHVKRRNPMLKDDAAFVLWFIQAYLVDSEETGKAALTGIKGDKSADAVIIDYQNEIVNIVQGKFHISEKYNEKRNDVLALADLSRMPTFSDTELDAFFLNMDPHTKQKIEEAITCLRKKHFKLVLYYITTGKCSKALTQETEIRARSAGRNIDIHILDYNRLIILYSDYLSDAAPPVHTITLKLVSNGPIQHSGVIKRFDPEKQIESWVLTATGDDIADMYAKEGRRLFARNIRGFLGSTEINESIGRTVDYEPSNFWYYNNGITIVCDNARLESQSGEEVLIIDGAQVINGQQTTRTLNEHQPKSGNTRVLVKVIKIPRASGQEEEYDKLVNTIVRATNWQNRISPYDLVSNDHIQIYIEKELRKNGYQYIRKKMTRSEARAHIGGQGYFQIDKLQLAQAVAGCLFDPSIVRKGKEGLFEDRYYGTIFSSRSISYYLAKFWLMKQVQLSLRGYPERAYAKWLVLRYAWNQLQSEISSGQKEKRFRYACEHRDVSMEKLAKYLDTISKAALKFFRLNRGFGARAIDVSTFFKRVKLDKNFEIFWSSDQNPYKEKAQKYLDQFKTRLQEMETE